MAAPSGKELGTRSPFKWRAGIDFQTWEGINRENDAGAIRDAQLQEGINIRVSGNEILCRGGQEKVNALANPLEGCVYSVFDVPEGETGLLLLANPQGSAPGSARLDRYYSEATPVYNVVFASDQTLQPTMTSDDFADQTRPRRSLTVFRGQPHQFGTDGETSTTTLYRIVMPPKETEQTGDQSVLQQAKLESVVEVPEFCSEAIRLEKLDDGSIDEVLYIGSNTTGKVYRWDGTSLTTETPNLASERIIVFVYAGDIYAAGTDELRKRGPSAAWSEAFAYPAAGFEPAAACEYLDRALIAGVDSGLPAGVVYDFDGTTITVGNRPTSGGEDAVIVMDVKPFNGSAYYLWMSNAVEGTFFGRVTNTTYTANMHSIMSEATRPGCLLPVGNRLFFAYSIETAGLQKPWLGYMSPAEVFIDELAGPATTDEFGMPDMIAW